MAAPFLSLKEQGNVAFQSGDFAGAIASYKSALERLSADRVASPVDTGNIHKNLAACFLKTVSSLRFCVPA